jgi:hypothetical protein
MEKHIDNHSNLKILRTGDPNAVLGCLTPKEVLARHGLPGSLLSTSAKTQKCTTVGVLARVMYLTPGVFCPAATKGCLQSCLGHTSGRMQMPTHATCRDRRAALYLENPKLFLQMLSVELSRLVADADTARLRAAARLNGSSDLPWETRHPELFRDFPAIDFFDYTKVVPRMKTYLRRDNWPRNYHMTFSAAPGNHAIAREILSDGGNVAVVFWPKVPAGFWGYPVINGDSHDARFLDPKGVIVGLKAKGLACVDVSGFTVRPCPRCGPEAPELKLASVSRRQYVTTVHQCTGCGFQLRERAKVHATPARHLAAAFQQAA